MKEVQLTKGKIALVDDKDYLDVLKYRWCYTSGYAWNAKLGLMHRYLMGLPYIKGHRGPIKGQPQVDHINGNKLDNQKKNLRIVNSSENQLNHSKTKGKSKYRGVIWAGSQKDLKKNWIVRIKLPNQSRKYLGSFESEIEAAKAYDKYAKEHCPEFTKLNFTKENV